MKNVINAGLIGFGTVGAGVAELMLADNRMYDRGRDFRINLVKIADLDITTDRGVDIPDGMLTTNADDILTDPDIDIVIELIGGYEPAKTFTLRAFENGKSVVTANKALVAKHASDLFEAAEKAGVSYLFEAAVGGGIPVLRSLANGLNANRIQSIYGILNGTTNYILTGMARDGEDYSDMLKNAQKLGYAEADPTADVEGHDALNKIVILCRLAFDAELNVEDIHCEGITHMAVEDIAYADELGYTIKLLAIAKRHEDGRVEARVHPTMVPAGSMMAYVEDEFNAIEVYGDAVGREIFYGKGAGKLPTASAVVSDTVDIASRLFNVPSGMVIHRPLTGTGCDLVDMGELTLRYYLRFTVREQPGVLAQISKIFAEKNISIESVIQIGGEGDKYVPIVIMTYQAREADMQEALSRFSQLDTVMGRIQMIRVEDV